MDDEIDKIAFIATTDIEELSRAIEEIKKVFSIVIDSINEFVGKIGIFISNAEKNIEEHQKILDRWTYKQTKKFHLFLLDRRLKRHRCRNCC